MILDRIADRLLIDDGCWGWNGNTSRDGYPKTGYIREGKFRGEQLVHRIMYRLLVDEIPEGLTLDHLCRNVGCVRPSHCEPVTRAENTSRTRGYRPLPSHCQYGHPFDEENTWLRVARNERVCKACNRRRTNAHYARRKDDGAAT